MGYKFCSKCGERKSTTKFFKSSRSNKFESQCKACRQEKIAEWRSKNRHKTKIYRQRWASKNQEFLKKKSSVEYAISKSEGRVQGLHLRRKYWPHLTWREALSEYKKLYSMQNGRCLICDKKSKLCVDHNHSTGKVRGLLCRTCNRALGYFRDDARVCFRAYQYLKQND